MPVENAMHAETSTGPLAFGPFTYDRANRLLWKDQVQVPLPPRAVGVLGLLLDRPGQLLSKQDLLSTIWPDAFVTETSLAEAISFLRQALADDSQNPTYIQTLHRRGYRFIADVRPARPNENGIREVRSTEFAAPGESSEPAPRLFLVVPWTIALFSVIVAGVAVWKFTETTTVPSRLPARFEIALPAGLTLSSRGSPIALSRDGMTIAFAACHGSDTRCALYLRPLSQSEPTEIAGSTGGSSPFFSPDGRSLGYFAANRLQTIALAGGSPIALVESVQPFGATWTSGNQIVFAGLGDGGLSIVSANGGPVTALTHATDGARHRWPDELPSGAAILFTVATEDSARPYAGIVSRRTGTWTRLMDGVAHVRAPLDGYLLAARGNDLLGVSFDERSLSVGGAPVSVVTGAGFDAFTPRFAMASAGTLVIAPPGSAVLQVVLDWGSELRRLVPAPQFKLPR